MTLNDPLASALSKIQNAEKVGKTECIVRPSSKIIKAVLKILKDNGYIKDIGEKKEGNKTSLKIILQGRINDCCAIKPRYPVKSTEFEKFEKRYLPAKDFGLLIVSTNKGILTHAEAKKKKTGGKLLAYCF